MARPTVLLVVALVLVVTEPGIASKPETISTLSRLPPLLDCGTAPVAPAGESDGEFRANVLSLLRVIPSAAAPAGFVTAQSGRTGRDRAFARALCFGAASNRSSSTGCRSCLSAAARDATGGCGASRRAGVWRAGCFLGYADTDATSAREDAFWGWFYADPSTTAATLEDGVCAGDRMGPDCARCFDDAVRAAAALPWLVRMRGEEVIVVGYSCCLRVQISVLPITIMDTRRFPLFSLMVLTMACQLGIVIGLLLLIVRYPTADTMNGANSHVEDFWAMQFEY